MTKPSAQLLNASTQTPQLPAHLSQYPVDIVKDYFSFLSTYQVVIKNTHYTLKTKLLPSVILLEVQEPNTEKAQ